MRGWCQVGVVVSSIGSQGYIEKIDCIPQDCYSLGHLSDGTNSVRCYSPLPIDVVAPRWLLIHRHCRRHCRCHSRCRWWQLGGSRGCVVIGYVVKGCVVRGEL